MLASLGLALIAGLLSTLSPCVLPLLPIVLGTAAGEHRLGPATLALGVMLSFVSIGLFVATIGFSIGLDGSLFETGAAVVLVALGTVMLVPRMQARFAVAAGPVGNWATHQFGRVPSTGLYGQFGVGLLLGAVWSPCVGPTLGAASVLAAQRQNLGEVAVTMAVFGAGTALPLIALGWLSRETFMRWRIRMMATGGAIKSLLGVILIVTGAAVLLGVDKLFEGILVSASPQWLTALTTRF